MRGLVARPYRRSVQWQTLCGCCQRFSDGQHETGTEGIVSHVTRAFPAADQDAAYHPPRSNCTAANDVISKNHAVPDEAADGQKSAI